MKKNEKLLLTAWAVLGLTGTMLALWLSSASNTIKTPTSWNQINTTSVVTDKEVKDVNEKDNWKDVNEKDNWKDINEKDNWKDVNEKDNWKETAKSEAADSAKLASKATVTEIQAKATANASYKWTIKKVSLNDEDGTIVYSVEYTDGTDVKVDANKNIVVKTDAAGSDNEKDNWKDGENPNK